MRDSENPGEGTGLRNSESILFSLIEWGGDEQRPLGTQNDKRKRSEGRKRRERDPKLEKGSLEARPKVCLHA